MFEKKNKCLKCNSVFGAWGKKPGRYGGFVDCCPTCGNTSMSSMKKNFGFGWTKLRIGLVGIVVSILGFVSCFYIAYAYFGLALISTGMIISVFALLIKSD